MPNSQLIATWTTSASFLAHFLVAREFSSLNKTTPSLSGPLKLHTTPRTAIAATIVHTLAIFGPPATYLVGVLTNGLRERPWMARCSLDRLIGYLSGRQTIVKGDTKDIVRAVSAALLLLVFPRVMSAVNKAIGDQFAPLGVRTKARVVKTGPYAIVRHPSYAVGILANAFLSIPLWSFVPLIASVVTTTAFIVKLRIEESIILRDADIGTQYKAYQRTVRKRLIPYVW